MKKIFITTFALFTLLFAEDFEDFDAEFSKNDNVYDPLITYNRAMTNFNDVLIRNVFVPVSRGYGSVVSPSAQKAIGNFFDNLLFPVRFVNNVLQLKFKEAGVESARFVTNTVIGFFGISDVASEQFGLARYDEDFGQTLGYWGVPSGVPIVIPIFGQSNVRDIFGLVGDYYANPLGYINEYAFGLNFARRTGVGAGASSLKTINMLSSDPDAYDKLTGDAIDLYLLMRSSYEQKRKQEIDQ